MRVGSIYIGVSSDLLGKSEGDGNLELSDEPGERIEAPDQLTFTGVGRRLGARSALLPSSGGRAGNLLLPIRGRDSVHVQARLQ